MTPKRYHQTAFAEQPTVPNGTVIRGSASGAEGVASATETAATGMTKLTLDDGGGGVAGSGFLPAAACLVSPAADGAGASASCGAGCGAGAGRSSAGLCSSRTPASLAAVAARPTAGAASGAATGAGSAASLARARPESVGVSSAAVAAAGWLPAVWLGGSVGALLPACCLPSGVCSCCCLCS